MGDVHDLGLEEETWISLECLEGYWLKHAFALTQIKVESSSFVEENMISDCWWEAEDF